MTDYQENRLGFWFTLKLIVMRTLGGAAILIVFVVSAFAAMRLAIHGREVTVPNLANLSDAEAAEALGKLGLSLSVENRFYAATVPMNHVLSQSPTAGASVRRGWQIRVTESLGSQQVPVPDVTGQDVQPAGLMLRRLQLEVGTVAHLPGPAPAGVVLAQSPPPNVAGIDGPRVALLIADEENAPASVGYVMPSLLGLSYYGAATRLSAVGLRLAAPVSPEPEPLVEAVTGGVSTGVIADPAIPASVTPTPPTHTAGVVVSQTPQPGRRVSRADTIHVTLSN